MPVWYRDDPNDDVEIFRGTVWEMAQALDAAKQEIERLRGDLQDVANCVDDVLYNPCGKVIDGDGNEIRGNERYLYDLPIMQDHLPALRQWFCNYSTREAADAAGEEE